MDIKRRTGLIIGAIIALLMALIGLLGPPRVGGVNTEVPNIPEPTIVPSEEDPNVSAPPQ